MSDIITDHMSGKGIDFLWQHTPHKLEQNQDGRLTMTWKDKDGSVGQENFDTVLFAIGRS